MEGLFIHKPNTVTDNSNLPDYGVDDSLSLLAKHGQFEIMTQYIITDAVIWLSPGVNEDSFEFFFVHEGELEIIDDTEPAVLRPGDSFFVYKLKQNIKLRCNKQAMLLYLSNCSVFDNEAYWQQNLQDLLFRIDEKDHYTRGHSYRVMGYALKLREQFESRCTWLSLEDFTLACLFHDVGKCNTPSEILQKPARLTNDEYNVIKKHPTDSQRILEPVFGEKIAQLACMHHERLDGRGYPKGLTGDQIPFEARILMVSDAFDAITSKRPYNFARTYISAAEELMNLSQQYDPVVTAELMELVQNGTIKLPKDGTDTMRMRPVERE